MVAVGWTKLLQNEGVCERKHHRDTNANQEGRIDQTSQQEHLGLEFVHEFGLTSSRLKILAAHDADPDASADGTQTNDQTGCEGNIAKNVFHLKLLEKSMEG